MKPTATRVLNHALLLTAAFVATACAGEDAGKTSLPVWTVGAPTLEVGGYDPGPGHQFERVIDAALLADGRLVVAEQAVPELRYFDSDGSLLRRTGGRGGGPQEFDAPFLSMARSGDTLVVLSRSELAWIDGQGTVVRRESLGRHSPGLPRCQDWLGAWGTLLADARVIVAMAPSTADGCPGGSAVPGPPPMAILFDRLTGRVDSLVALPGIAPGDGNRITAFGNILLAAVGDNRLYVGSSDADSVAVFDLAGRWVDTWRVHAERRAVPREVRDSVPARLSPVPERYPLIGHLIADGAGNLWVLHYPPLDTPLPS
ncbi:MAG: hypothetical protein WEB88_01145, partial [Gemmatimonadota bacterium]